MEQETKTTRVRANFSTNSKGLAQLDITAEAPTVKEMEELLSQAIDSVEKTLSSKKIEMIHRSSVHTKLED